MKARSCTSVEDTNSTARRHDEMVWDHSLSAGGPRSVPVIGYDKAAAIAHKAK